jgi:hypothetical protein
MTNHPDSTEAAEAPQAAQEAPAAARSSNSPDSPPEAVRQGMGALPEAPETHANPAPRPWTPDRANPDGSTRITLKRACNGCSKLLGDLISRDADAHGNLTDVRAECPNCRPLVEAEAAGCKTWQVTERSISRVDFELDRLDVYAKGYWEDVDGKLRVVGLRVGTGETRVVARFGDWLIMHPDSSFTVHPAPEAVTA